MLRLLPYKKYYSKLDLKSGYWQFLLGPIAQELSTFITPFGQYRWIYISALVYLDDVICWGDSLEEMEGTITIIVNSLSAAGLKLNGEKSCFLTKKLEVLGHWVESGVIKPDHGKLNWVKLDCTTVTQVKSLIGALSYFRKFIPKFSDIIRPILDL
jgi:hypothetical protein